MNCFSPHNPTLIKLAHKSASLSGNEHGPHSIGIPRYTSHNSEPLNSLIKSPAVFYVSDEFEIDSIEALAAFISEPLHATTSDYQRIRTNNDCEFYFSLITQPEEAKTKISDIKNILKLPYPHPDETLPSQFCLVFIGHGEEKLIKICNGIILKTLVFFNGCDPLNLTIRNPNVIGALWIQQDSLESLIAKNKQRRLVSNVETDPQLENIKKELRAEMAAECRKLRTEMDSEHQKLREELVELRNNQSALTTGQENLRKEIQELTKRVDEFTASYYKY